MELSSTGKVRLPPILAFSGVTQSNIIDSIALHTSEQAPTSISDYRLLRAYTVDPWNPGMSQLLEVKLSFESGI